MAITFNPVPGVIRVPLGEPFPAFSVLVVPAPDLGENFRTFYLTCKGFGVVVDMFSCAAESDEEAADLAYYNGPDYIDGKEYQ